MARWIVSFALAILLACSWKEGSAPAAPEELHSAHYTLSLEDGLSPREAQSMLDRLEVEHARITTSLGVDPGVRVTVRVWRSESAFQARMERDLGVRFPGAGGYVTGPTEARVLFQHQAPQIAVHECAHAHSLQLNPHFGNRPRWLWEAVAIFEAEEFVDPRTLPYLAGDPFPTLQDLSQLPGPEGQKIYELGWLLAAFIRERWGVQPYRDLIQTNGDVPRVLGLTEPMFQTEWASWVKARYLSPHSDRSHPAPW